MQVTSRNLTVLLNDIVGSTSMIAHRSRQAMMELLQTFDALMRPVILHYGGRIVKTIGDAYLTVFESPTDAVLCAIRMQYVLRGYNKSRPEADQIHVRIAINSGEMQIVSSGDVFGEAVNLTARLAGVTEADQIYLTEQVYLIMNRNEVPDTLAVKRFSFKGIAEEVTVYRVVQNDDNAVYARIVADRLKQPDAPGAVWPSALQKARGLAIRWRWWLAGGLAAGAVIAVLTHLPERHGRAPSPARAEAAPATSSSSSHAPAAKPSGSELDQLIEHLGSEDDNEVREAATRLVRSRVTDRKAMSVAADKLLRSCAERPGNEVHADAMGWLCNLLGQSEGTEYVAVLEKVAEKTVHTKVKRYAQSNIESLKRHAARAQAGTPPS